MSSPDKHIGSWSMSDVHKYLRGELSGREMHALEKAALDDPFLADALEGLASRTEIATHTEIRPQHPTNDGPASPLEQDLASLKARLADRVAEKKTRLFLPWMRVAAAVILLAGLGVTAIITTGKHKADTARTGPLRSSAADTAAAVASAATAKPAGPAPSEPATAAAKPATSTTPPAAQVEPTPDGEVAALSKAAGNATLARRQAPLAVSQPKEAKITSLADSMQVVDSMQIAEKLAANGARNQVSSPAVTISKDSINYNADLRANSKTLSGRALLFAGQVRDVNNRPLAGVSLVLDSRNSRTVTDEEGYFKLYVPPRDTVRKLTVHFVGYDETSVALNDENRFGNIITLKERQSSLREVVVTGFGATRKATMAAPPSDDAEKLDSLWTKAAPVIGRVAYLDYLAAGKKGLGADSTIRGTVSISFEIDSKGQPVNFKIERSLSPIQDAGVIRLISEGSAWQLFHGKKARLLVSVSFP